VKEDRWQLLKTVTWFGDEQREVEAYVEELRSENRSLSAFKTTVDEALNSGDGTYRP